MRAVVTGCAGFIGYHLARALAGSGAEVVGIDCVNDAYDVRLKEWRLEQLGALDGFRFERRDITRSADLDASRVDGADVVYHLAARAGVRRSLSEPRLYLEANVLGTLSVLEWCRRLGVRTAVLASTSSVYGQQERLPLAEAAPTDRPLSPYAASKKAAEVLAASYAHLYGLDVPVVRYFTVYGPAGRPDLSIFRFVQAVFEGREVRVNGDGTQSRDFTFVDDAVRGTIAVAEQCRGSAVVNIGSDSPVVLLDVLRLVESEVGRTARIDWAPLPPADVKATWADISFARSLGWEPRVPFADGIRATVNWYRENRAWASQLITGD